MNKVMEIYYHLALPQYYKEMNWIQHRLTLHKLLPFDIYYILLSEFYHLHYNLIIYSIMKPYLLNQMPSDNQ